MNNVSNLVQKYRQAPWRVQRQWLGLVLLGVVLVALVAAIYLNVSARVTLAGRQIQILEEEISGHLLFNADKETELARLTTTATMEERAQALGFQPANPEDVVYVVVPGYAPPPDIDLSTNSAQPPTKVIQPEYTQSLLEWFTEWIQASAPAAGGRP